MRYCIALIMVLCTINIPVALNASIPAPMLKAGDTVGLVSSGFRIDNNHNLAQAKARLQKIGLNVIVGKAVLGHDGYFPGSDQARANDINNMFADPKVKAIIEIRGGWGSARILPLLDYTLIKTHPKIFVGYSDITSLLFAIHCQTGLIVFHGPMPGVIDKWSDYSAKQLQHILFNATPPQLKNPPDMPTTTITPGVAQGVLIGGSLSVLTSIIGSKYFPTDWHGKILFLEDTYEDAYQIDRMLTQLALAGILQQISGFIFGTCSHCTHKIPGSPSILQIIKQHIKPLQIPAWYGAAFGHQANMYTLPFGAKVKIDATAGTIDIMQPVVVAQKSA